MRVSHRLMGIGVDMARRVLEMTSYPPPSPPCLPPLSPPPISLLPSLPLYLAREWLLRWHRRVLLMPWHNKSLDVLTHLGNTPGWNPQHEGCVSQSVNTLTLPRPHVLKTLWPPLISGCQSNIDLQEHGDANRLLMDADTHHIESP